MIGIRAQLVVEAPGDCPVAEASRDVHQPVKSINRSTATRDGEVVEEFSMDADDSFRHPEVETVYSDGDSDVHRFSRRHHNDCVCQTIESAISSPASNIYADDGALFVSFNAVDQDNVRKAVRKLREQFDGVRITSLTRLTNDETDSDSVLVDRSRLTDRQREVLETAHEMGYFEYPKGANACDVANTLGISPSTFREHLMAAQSKLFETLLDTSPSARL